MLESVSEDDFYGQDFDADGVVSVWVGQSLDDPDADVLQTFCGVGYYDLDRQEMSAGDEWPLLPVRELIGLLSDSASFIDAAMQAAQVLGISHARWALAQYEFKYDPAMAIRDVADDPRFLGAFSWNSAGAEQSHEECSG